MMDASIRCNERLLCTQCSVEYDRDSKLMGFQKVVQILEEKQIQKLQEFEKLAVILIQQIEEFQIIVHNLKSQLFQQLDFLLEICRDQINNLYILGQKYSQFSFFQELDNLIKNENGEFLIKPEINSIQNIWKKKMLTKLEQFKVFEIYKKLQEILKKSLKIEEMPIQNNSQTAPNSPQKKSQQLFSIHTPSVSTKKINNQSPQKYKQVPFSPQQTQKMKTQPQEKLIIKEQEKENKKRKLFIQKITEVSYKQQEECYAIAINHDNTLLVAAANQHIKIFELNLSNTEKNQPQSLDLNQYLFDEHSCKVSTLNFFNNSSYLRNSFISGSQDSKIIIQSPSSSQNKPLRWRSSVILDGHSNYIRCIIVHPFQDMIISGSHDKTIRFWSSHSISNQWPTWRYTVWALSMNQNGTKLISSGNDQKLLVMVLSSHSVWLVQQQIDVKKRGYRLSFITNDLFVFQQESVSKLSIYVFDSNSSNFKKNEEFSISGEGQTCDPRFPCIFNSNKSLLISKNGHQIQIIRYREALNYFQVEEIIDFKGDYLRGGSLSQDGEFLVFWDKRSSEIQIRQLHEQ
ncbi:unnamed protein product [Paramecium sonneborni]|uniref:Uncharacterized protein n=1 Tax=Paramecium sonneborni TaxID=65129 RepID=A0A8S1QUG4_9CILI|nr:unnamed protein product [Paramecium sonneborni]